MTQTANVPIFVLTISSRWLDLYNVRRHAWLRLRRYSRATPISRKWVVERSHYLSRCSNALPSGLKLPPVAAYWTRLFCRQWREHIYVVIRFQFIFGLSIVGRPTVSAAYRMCWLTQGYELNVHYVKTIRREIRDHIKSRLSALQANMTPREVVWRDRALKKHNLDRFSPVFVCSFRKWEWWVLFWINNF